MRNYIKRSIPYHIRGAISLHLLLLRKVVKRSTESKREPKRVAESLTKSSREVTIKDVNNNSKAMKRLPSESLAVVITKKKPKRQTCFMTGCGQPVSSLKRHVVGKHLTLVFATWKEMSREERMFSYNQSLISLETALGLTTHDELLQMVVDKQWFPVGSRFTIPDEDVTFVKEFHQWLTGRQMTTEPTIDPPNCIAVLTNWRIFSTVLNCIGKEKVILPTPGVQSVEETAGTTVAQPGKDPQLIKTDQVVQPVQVAQPEIKGTQMCQQKSNQWRWISVTSVNLGI